MPYPRIDPPFRSFRFPAKPNPLNYVLPAIILFITLLFPFQFCNAQNDASSSHDPDIILFENWENENFKNWDDDFREGDTTIETDPVYEGKYAIKQRASNPGSLVHFFGDHPGVDEKTIDDITLESYLYFPTGFQWPSGGITLWTMASFESWGAGYNKAKGKGKPLTWAPYYVMIALKGNGAPLAFLTRADGLGGTGELYKTFRQNIGKKEPLKLGAWTQLKFRLKLNSPGKFDGIFQLWLNDKLKCNYENINFRGSYCDHGWNHLMMSFLGNPSKANTQWVSRDNIILKGVEESFTVPKVRKKIVRKTQSPKLATQLDQSSLAQTDTTPPTPKPPTGLIIRSSPTKMTSVPLSPSLPEGNHGLAAKYPGDKGIENDPNVIFVENFNEGSDYGILDPTSLQLIFSRWDTVKEKEAMSLSDEVPDGSGDDRSLLVSHLHGQKAAYLYRQLLPGHSKLFVRYYVKFDPQCAPVGHFGAWIGGYNPPTTWPQGGAGTRPSGMDRFTTGVEPYGDDWAWDFYTYWPGMHVHGGGKYWGTTFLVGGPKPPIEKGKWICVETMVQMNNPVTSSNGSQAFWIDGKLFRKGGQIASHFGPGFPKGEWAGGWWKPDAKSASTFEGFQWRSVENLAINFLWMQVYQPKAPKGSTSKIWFDNIVAAKEYIGPISP